MNESKQVVIKKQVVSEIFVKVFDSSNAVNAALVSSTDGHALAKHTKRDLNESTLAAMTSSCIALGDRIASEVNQNGCELTIIQNSDGYLVIKRVGKKLVITVMADKDVNLGMLLTATKNAAKLLEQEMESQR